MPLSIIFQFYRCGQIILGEETGVSGENHGQFAVVGHIFKRTIGGELIVLFKTEYTPKGVVRLINIRLTVLHMVGRSLMNERLLSGFSLSRVAANKEAIEPMVHING